MASLVALAESAGRQMLVVASSAASGTQAAAQKVSQVADSTMNASEAAASVATVVAQKAPVAPPQVGLGNYLHTFGALFLVIGILYSGLWLLKRLGRSKRFQVFKRADGNLQFIQQYHIGHKRTLVEVQYGSKRLLLGVTDHNINLLTEMVDSHDSDSFEECLETVRSDSPSS